MYSYALSYEAVILSGDVCWHTRAKDPAEEAEQHK